MTDPSRGLRDAEPKCFWLDDPRKPPTSSALVGNEESDLAVIGGGYSGLWTALIAKERNPKRDVVLLEAQRVGGAATGRNGGFCDASLTHGFSNGLARFGDELPTLERLGQQNLDGIDDTIQRYAIDCGFERPGAIDIATAPWQFENLKSLAEKTAQFGHNTTLLDTEQVQSEIKSPTYFGGLQWNDRQALVNPAKLAWGLSDACKALGVRIYENSPVNSVSNQDSHLYLKTPYGSLKAAQAVLATNAFQPLIQRLRFYIVPVYDYALVTEPLSDSQCQAIGWKNRQGLSDSSNLFHYYRLTPDNRILWGGYDVVYNFGNRISRDLEQRSETFVTLAQHFYETFPQLEDLRFTHTWGGVIDTCSRFCVFFGQSFQDKLAYALGYTGLGVGVSRFAAEVMLDLLSGQPTELTQLNFVKRKPLPFPPEPLRWPLVNLTTRSLLAADQNAGKRNLWLRTLDRFGLGITS